MMPGSQAIRTQLGGSIKEGGNHKLCLDRSHLDPNWTNILPRDRSPMDHLKLCQFLLETKYDQVKSDYLVQGLLEGFRLRLDRSVIRKFAKYN